MRYASFINSPRICFIYDTFFYTMFLLLFSYLILCEFVYYVDELGADEADNGTNDSVLLRLSHHSNETILSEEQSNSTDSGAGNRREITIPSALEWTVIAWVLTYIIEELRQA